MVRNRFVFFPNHRTIAARQSHREHLPAGYHCVQDVISVNVGKRHALGVVRPLGIPENPAVGSIDRDDAPVLGQHDYFDRTIAIQIHRGKRPPRRIVFNRNASERAEVSAVERSQSAASAKEYEAAARPVDIQRSRGRRAAGPT